VTTTPLWFRITLLCTAILIGTMLVRGITTALSGAVSEFGVASHMHNDTARGGRLR